MAVDTATQRSRVRSWEHDGSGGTLSGSVRNGHRARLDLSDVQERPMTAALHERALVRIEEVRAYLVDTGGRPERVRQDPAPEPGALDLRDIGMLCPLR